MEKLEIEAGKSYLIRYPNSGDYEPSRVHIDYILDHPKYNQLAYKLVVYRVWIKHKKYWKCYLEPYYVLAMWNEWKYDFK